MLKRVFIGIGVLFGAALIALIVFVAYVSFWLQPLNFSGNGASQERVAAKEWLTAEVAAFSCMTTHDLRDIAAKRNWLVERHEHFDWCIDKQGLTNWTSVRVEPGLMMSTEDENRRYFGFDAQGCSVTWTYDTCR